MAREKRVVITGYGAVSSMGYNADMIWRGILDKTVGYKIHQFEDERIKSKFFGFMEKELPRDTLKPFTKSLLRKLPSFATYALVAAEEAINHAFKASSISEHYNPFDRGVIIGTGWGGVDAMAKNHTEYLSTKFASPFTTIQTMPSTATAAISMHFGFNGYQNSPVAACASGAISIGEAVEVIRRGQARCMLAGGSESLKEVFNVWAVDVLGALSKEAAEVSKACCPFSLGRSGFVLSEGAAVICLEEMDSALRRGAKIIAEIAGYRTCSDAHDFTAPSPDGQGRIDVISGAIRNADISPNDINYVNAHGTSTPLNDYYESIAIKEVLGKWAYDVPISSTKSYTGHLIGAAGALETLICAKVIESQIIPATIHLTEPDPKCDLNYVPNGHLVGQDVRVCLNLSFGFGGANTALIINRVEP